MSSTRSKFAIAREKLGRLSLSERALLLFSRHPDETDQTINYEKAESAWEGEAALDMLRRAWPDLEEGIKGRDLVDFGCGDGHQTLALLNLGAKSVTGIDLVEIRLQHARELVGDREDARFATKVEPNSCEVLISMDAFEHLDDPKAVLEEMISAVRPGGRIVLSFGPPWYSPHGAHMWFFTTFPWFHLVVPERSVMRIRSLYRDDGCESYFPGLNQMSIRAFEKLLKGTGLIVETLNLRGPKGTGLLRRTPIVRELFITHVDAIVLVGEKS